jgi:hypothetical protein
MWNEVVMAIFKVMSQHLPVGAKENHKKRSKQLVSWPKLKPGTSWIQVRSIITKPTCFLWFHVSWLDSPLQNSQFQKVPGVPIMFRWIIDLQNCHLWSVLFVHQLTSCICWYCYLLLVLLLLWKSEFVYNCVFYILIIHNIQHLNTNIIAHYWRTCKYIILEIKLSKA